MFSYIVSKLNNKGVSVSFVSEGLSFSANKEDAWAVEFLTSFKFNPLQHRATIQLIKELDARRGLNFEKVFPELVPYFTKY